MIDADDSRQPRRYYAARSVGPVGAVYGLGFVGAVFYFVQQSSAFWPGVLGVLKALVWPALLVYKGMGLLGL